MTCIHEYTYKDKENCFKICVECGRMFELALLEFIPMVYPIGNGEPHLLIIVQENTLRN